MLTDYNFSNHITHNSAGLCCFILQMKMTGAIRQQLNSFLEGFYDIIPKKLISIFNEQELELLVSGLPTVDIDDLKANTEYHKYQATSLQVVNNIVCKYAAFESNCRFLENKTASLALSFSCRDLL